MFRKCIICKKEFYTYPSRIKIGKGKFCSKKCCNKLKIGIPPWNKGKKGLYKWTPERHKRMVKFMIGNSFAKGKNLGNTHGFTKGFTPWNKGKKVPQISNEKNPNWKGDNVGYVSLHMWVKRHKGKATKCIHCGQINGKIEWANINHLYNRVLKDFISLCVSCHRNFDIKHNHYTKVRHK